MFSRTLSSTMSALRRPVTLISKKLQFSSVIPSPKANSESYHAAAPFPLRLLLVSSTAGLLTPLYAFGGAALLWYTYLPRTSVGRLFKGVMGLLIGGGGIAFAYYGVLPFIIRHSEILAPFCLANALCAGAWYGAAEFAIGFDALVRGPVALTGTLGSLTSSLRPLIPPIVFGGAAAITRIPVLGAALGMLTSACAPLLWPACFELCWSPSFRRLILDDTPNWLATLYFSALVPVALPVGFVSGVALEMALLPLLSTSSAAAAATPWHLTSAAIALAVVLTAGTGYFVFGRESESAWWWVRRIDPTTGIAHSHNLSTGARLQDGGASADTSAVKLFAIAGLHVSRKAISSFFSNDSAVFSIDDEVAKTRTVRSISEVELSYGGLQVRNNLYGLVDILLRDVFLRTQSANVDSNTLSRQRAELSQVASKVYGVSNLNSLVDQCILAIDALKRKPIAGAGSIGEVSEISNDASAASLENLFSRNEHHQFSVSLLETNLPVLECELASQLNFVVDDAVVAEVLARRARAAAARSFFPVSEAVESESRKLSVAEISYLSAVTVAAVYVAAELFQEGRK